jgi:hypothetical protein
MHVTSMPDNAQFGYVVVTARRVGCALADPGVSSHHRHTIGGALQS